MPATYHARSCYTSSFPPIIQAHDSDFVAFVMLLSILGIGLLLYQQRPCLRIQTPLDLCAFVIVLVHAACQLYESRPEVLHAHSYIHTSE